MWFSADYYFASTFSYKIPDFSMYYAASAPIPSPSTFKVALVSSLINQTNDLPKVKEFFERTKISKILFGLPEYVTIYRAFIRRLKKKRFESGFDRTFGIREYVIFSGPLTIHIDSPKDVKNEMIIAMKNVRYLGSSDSICTCDKLEENHEPLIETLARPYDGVEQQNGIIFQLRDFTENVTFEKINRYGHERLRLEKDVKIVPYILPIKVEKRGRNFTTYKK